MLRSMITSTNTMTQLQRQLDVIGHNLSNIDTQGYKRTETNFNELLRQQFNNQPDRTKEIGRLTDFGIRQGTGARLTTSTVFTQGSLKQTGRKLDVAFTNPGQFLQVNVDGEIRYTRDGSLYLSPNENGLLTLVTSEGHQVLDENQNPIIFDDTFSDLAISQNGTITASSKDGNELPQIANLGIVRVDKPSALEQAGGNLYSINAGNANINDVLTYLDGDNRQLIGLQQGSLEMSNVDLSKEMTELMLSQRSYQMNAKSITMGDQMLGLINGVRS
ncbi:flagellar hook-basal body protein [Metabacillus fastidiosus]|uniref:Flagellar hook-basal body protein n=1 Tax=Metabacillus fastidiosus TaxID=1458 RepID=A0ABU6P3H3_9BACI|nr:flagellar hook-basal body protein [Metabacillus fastidiosus]